MTDTLKAAALSFFSGHFYGELARKRKGIGMRLVMLLTLASTLFLCMDAFWLDPSLRNAIRQMPALAPALPAVTLKDGKLSIDKPMPYRINLSSEPDSMGIVVDTRVKIDDALSQYLQKNNILLLLTADKAVINNRQKKDLEIYDLKDAQPFTISHEQWVGYAESVKQWGMVALTAGLFLTTFFLMFVSNLSATIFAAVACMAADLVAKTGLEFSAAMRLGAAFHIPVVILSMLPAFLGMPPLTGTSEWVLWGLYLTFAVSSVRLYGGGKT